MITMDDEPVPIYGTLSKAEAWRLQRHYFPSKLGGYPAWLNPVDLPEENELHCDICSSIMTFAIQVYAPDDIYEENDAFHRVIYTFVCQPCGTNWKAFRSQLPRQNDFYDYHPVDDNIIFPDSELISNCCLACGLPSNKVASEPIPNINSLKVALVDSETEFRELHYRCNIAVKYGSLSPVLDEWILNICEGEIAHDEDYLSHEKSLYEKYIDNKNAGEEEMTRAEEEDVENMQEENKTIDESFMKFCKKTTPNEVLYYCRGGEPLWISDRSPRPVIDGANLSANDESEIMVPKCESCSGPRSFEFQILPQLLFYISSDRIEFGSVSVYTCSKSCKISGYQKEYILFEKDYSMVPKPRSDD
ncbi:conserved hypothetical protein [Theileria equi strain WA]|uniref:Programmed cell death protein 2 C-terminal domain-containing protein n=1 Tax=Theileria equi strain WA TaxID=1537102 RepID=L1LG61_THEEQ|nr:conserved hypothetical protein [Theileria equi strain WA]EKX74341.1 conserved hypothetical protein [Theileria equi strain WA]|eukprot:XP_004833793.1 conserved hypothetical protein [Theileria equi strain WA]